MSALFVVPESHDDPETDIPAPADGWCAAAVDLWLSTFTEADEDGETLDARATALLTHACDAVTHAATLRDAVGELPELTTVGSTSQTVAHPLLGAYTAAQASALAAMKALAVPPATTIQTAAASNARWAR